MSGIAFELKGKTAFFKKPDVNEKIYMTYSQIHKVALLGIFGAILGLGGHIQQQRDKQVNGDTEENRYPAFYEKLKDLRVSIVPKGQKGYFVKKRHMFTNTVGYANKGSNLLVNEQWLENPHWTVYIERGEVEESLYEQLVDYLLHRKAVFVPYLGKNDHFAEIENPRAVTYSSLEQVDHYDSLVLEREIVYLEEEDTYDEEVPFYFKEIMPYTLEHTYNYYEYETLVYTNICMKPKESFTHTYECEGKTLFFM